MGGCLGGLVRSPGPPPDGRPNHSIAAHAGAPPHLVCVCVRERLREKTDRETERQRGREGGREEGRVFARFHLTVRGVYFSARL